MIVDPIKLLNSIQFIHSDMVNSYCVAVKGNIGLVLLSGTEVVVINIYVIIICLCLIYFK